MNPTGSDKVNIFQTLCPGNNPKPNLQVGVQENWEYTTVYVNKLRVIM